MNRLCCWLLGLAFALTAFSARAEDKPKPPDKPSAPAPGSFPMLQPLLPPGALERMGLNEKQKEEIEKLQKEINEKQHEAIAKMKAAYEKALKEGGKEGTEKIKAEMQEMAKGIMKQRQELQAKLKEILTAEQHKKYEAMMKEGRFGPAGGPGAFMPPGMGFRMVPGHVLPPPVQEMLKLTAEQKEKVAKLQKEAEDKIMEVLTDEQKKQLEEMKKRFTGGSPPPRPARD